MKQEEIDKEVTRQTCGICDGYGEVLIPLSHTAPRDEIPKLVGKYRREVCWGCGGDGYTDELDGEGREND